GRVDEARLRLALLDGAQHGAHVLLADEAGLVAGEEAPALERLARVLARRDARVGDRPVVALREPGEEGLPVAGAAQRAPLRRDADELVAREDDRVAVEPLRLAQEVDPIGARRDEDVGRCPVLDLARELARGAEARHDARALEALREALDDLGEARRGEDAGGRRLPGPRRHPPAGEREPGPERGGGPPAR